MACYGGSQGILTGLTKSTDHRSRPPLGLLGPQPVQGELPKATMVLASGAWYGRLGLYMATSVNSGSALRAVIVRALLFWCLFWGSLFLETSQVSCEATVRALQSAKTACWTEGGNWVSRNPE